MDVAMNVTSGAYQAYGAQGAEMFQGVQNKVAKGTGSLTFAASRNSFVDTVPVEVENDITSHDALGDLFNTAYANLAIREMIKV